MKTILCRYCLFCTLLFSGLVHADALLVKTMSTTSYDNEQGATHLYSMPFVESKDTKVSSRINNFIFISALGTLAPVKLNDTKLHRNQEDSGNPKELSYRILGNDDRILSINIEAEGCGAYCENYNTYYNFDAKSGRHLEISDLFSATGWEAFKKQLVTARQEQIKQAILELNKLVKTGNEEAEDYKLMIEMYQECATLIANPEYASNDFSLDNKTATFLRERCSNHAMRALDEIGEFANVYSLQALRPYLSGYGKTLLLNEGSVNAPSSFLNQILHGTIGGKIPITMLLNDDDYNNTISGVYFYDKYRLAISLSGTQQGNSLTLTESESKDDPKPTIKASIGNGRIKGEWLGKKKLSFEVEP